MLSIAGGVLEAVSSPTFAFANGITRVAGTMITSAIKSATVIKVALKISSYFPQYKSFTPFILMEQLFLLEHT